MATMADLMRTEGKAELIAGEVVRLPPNGHRPSAIAGRIIRSLYDLSDVTGTGIVGTSTLVYGISKLPNGRESFCPDASFHTGPEPDNPMSYVRGSPTFAVEVRGLEDYEPGAEAAMAAKRADYFAAGTLVVWDVDPEAGTVASHRTAPTGRTPRPCSPPARPPTPSRRCRGGRSPSIG